jgi:hypothetical protein
MSNTQHYQNQLLQERFALKLAARLSETTEALPHDISERLRAARVQALGHRKAAQARTASTVVMSGGAAALTFGQEETGWWSRIASALPLIALIAGLVAINMVQIDNRANELAEVDAALLTDDLPPAAYTDPGFLQFLKSDRDQPQ